MILAVYKKTILVVCARVPYCFNLRDSSQGFLIFYAYLYVFFLHLNVWEHNCFIKIMAHSFSKSLDTITMVIISFNFAYDSLTLFHCLILLGGASYLRLCGADFNNYVSFHMVSDCFFF